MQVIGNYDNGQWNMMEAHILFIIELMARCIARNFHGGVHVVRENAIF